ncbi:MAG: pitrilysin family protein [bacterium]|nr:pitrilysin family protein [bacterium]
MELNITQIKTNIGVPLWTLSSSSYSSVTLGVLIGCGARDENWPREAGIAHALEHMLFQGTKNFPNNMKLSSYIETIGGEINGRTSSERTLYHARVPIGYAERGVRVLSEQINASIFPDEKIPVEMKNIIQEIRRMNDDPQGHLWHLSQRFIYNNHPLSREVSGTEDSVAAFAKRDFLSFKERFYNPANYVFIAVGNISQGEALKLFNRYFDGNYTRTPNTREKVRIIRRAERQFIERRELDQLHLSIDALIGKGRDKSSLYLEFFRDMISSGMSSPLFQEVRDKRGLCYVVMAGLNKCSDIGRFRIYIGTDSKRYKEAIVTTLRVIEKSKKDEHLLDKIKKLKLGRLMLRYENTLDVFFATTDDIVFLGRPRGLEEIKKEIEEVTIDDIRKSVDKYLNPDLIYITMLAPKNFVEE